MQPFFSRINDAIRYTLEYYSIGRIKDYMFRFAGTERGYTVPHHLDTWYELIFELHQRMEDEINQTIHTTNQNTQVYMFETLKDWLNDYRIAKVNTGLILRRIDEYNDKTYREFEDKVQKQVEAFQQNPNYSRAHLEQYETIERPLMPFMLIPIGEPRKVTKTNYKYLCIEEKPELIDLCFVHQYFPVVDSIVQNFRRIVTKYVQQYDAGKIVPNHQVIVQTLPSIPQQQLLTAPSEDAEPKEKIRWSGTPKEFVQTFNPLIKNGTLKYKGNSDTETIVRMLYDTFRIEKARGDGELTLSSLSTYFKKENSGETY